MSDIKLCAVTVASNREHPGFLRLQRSCKKYGWELRLAGEPGPWLGVGTKLTLVQALLPKLLEEKYTHICLTDGNDTVCVGSPSEFIRKYRQQFNPEACVISTEIACWPIPELQKQYPKLRQSKWEYVNSGGYVCPIPLLQEILIGCEQGIVEYGPHRYDDQAWFATKYLSNKYPIFRDDGCHLYQTLGHGFSWPHQHWSDDFGIDGGRPVNWNTGTRPIFWHAQGGMRYDAPNEKGYNWIPGLD